MFCAYIRPRYQVSVYRTIGPLVYYISLLRKIIILQQNFATKLSAFKATRGHISKVGLQNDQ